MEALISYFVFLKREKQIWDHHSSICPLLCPAMLFYVSRWYLSCDMQVESEL